MEGTTNQEKNSNNYHLIGRLFALALPFKKTLLVTATLAVVLAPLSTLRPYLIQYTVDHHILTYDFQGLVQMMMYLVILLFVEAFLNYVFIYSSNSLGQSVIHDLRIKVFKHITSLRARYFDNTPVGQSTTRTISDIETINSVFTEGGITIIADMLTIIAVLGIMLYTSWELTLISLATLPFLIWATYIFKEKVKSSFQIVRTQLANMNTFLQERITGMRVVQIFNVEKEELEKFKAINQQYTKANLDSILYYAVFFPVVEILSAASLGLMVWWGARGVIDQHVTLGALVAFPIYLNMLFRPVRVLADKFNTLQMGLVASEKVFNILDNDQVIPNHGKIIAQNLRGDISFQHVFFSYNDKDLIIKDLNFNLDAHQTLAVVGSTGAGKSTIINMLNRFYDIDSGNILIDGIDIKDYELGSLRRRIAVVLQDVFLFSGTVLENITLRDERISRQQAIDAAKMIGAHEFIEKLPNGYDYQVMERGATLSMGQRQLISFVRALVFDPDILILDEATSSIDSETESIIQFAIEKLITKRTSIIIAHRLSTIRHANKIMVLDKGELQEIGTHEDLMQREQGQYRQLYEMQLTTLLA